MKYVELKLPRTLEDEIGDEFSKFNNSTEVIYGIGMRGNNDRELFMSRVKDNQVQFIITMDKKYYYPFKAKAEQEKCSESSLIESAIKRSSNSAKQYLK
jgi:hypothetical protein